MNDNPPVAKEPPSRQPFFQLILAILRWLICLILRILCLIFGRWIPIFCTLHERFCEQRPTPPTSELSEPTGCRRGENVTLTDSSGPHHHPFLVEIRGKAFGGSFTGYRLAYRAGSSGSFVENDDAIRYPDNRTNADLGPALFPTPVGSAIADGTLGYLDALTLTEGHYEIRLRVESGGATRILGFDLQRDYVEINQVQSLVVPDPFDEASQLANAAGGTISVHGSANTSGCASLRVDRFTLEVAEGHLTLAGALAAPRTLVVDVDYTLEPEYAIMPRPQNGELTIELFKSTCGFPPFVWPCGRSRPDRWGTISGSLDRFNVTGLNGRYTLLLTVHYSDSSVAHESQQLWVDNRRPVAWISKIEQNQSGTWVDVSGCEPISKALGTQLRLVGVALDPLILPTEPATHPNLNYDGLTLQYSKDGGSTFLPIPPLGPGPFGAVAVNAAGETQVGPLPEQPPIITTEDVIAEWDISAMDPCAYIIRLRVTDTTAAVGAHLGEFFYALTIAD